jgi:CheY-like chemotaxis protein
MATAAAASLMVHAGVSAPTARADAEPLRAAASLDGVCVLVVDDDEQSRAIVAEYLESQHASVRTAASAAEAFELLQRDPPDVLLADIAMPGEDGYTLIRRVRACASPALASIPAAALTSFARDEDRQQALQAGFHAHVSKPIDPRSLIDAVAGLRKLHVT